MKEIWKDIKGYEGLYQVSNLGRVRSLNRYVIQKNAFGNMKEHCYKGKILKLFEDKDGYLRVNLKKNNIMKQYSVHVLVANEFITNKNDFKYMPYEIKTNINLKKLQVNHKDENKQNNCVSNLEWCSNAYNINYGSRASKIIQLDMEGNIIKYWDSIKIASIGLKMSRNSIRAVLEGKKDNVRNFKFKYYKEDRKICS
jgi:hypothetical protein